MHFRSLAKLLTLSKAILPTASSICVGLVTATSAHALTFTFNTSDSRFLPGINNQGWWSDVNSNSDSNENYYVGDGELRNFFTFDLSALNSTHVITSARLELQRSAISGDAVEIYGLFDVSTDAATLNNNNGTNASIFNDLGSGKSYGTFNVSTTDTNDLLAFTLNSAALADIDLAKGGFFSIGGALLSIDNPDITEYLFGFSGGAQRLIVETDSVAQPIPTPALLPGLVGLGMAALRKRKNQGETAAETAEV
jgi:hypothetical protein